MTLFVSCVLVFIGFSVGAAVLLSLAFAFTYRSMAMPLQSRLAGYVMLLGFAVTQVLHGRYLLGLDDALITRGYVVVVVFQSLGFYWLFLGLLRPAEKKWSLWEWAVLPAAIVGGAIVPLE